MTTDINSLKFNKSTVIYAKLTTKTPVVAVFSVTFEQISYLVLIMKAHITMTKRARALFKTQSNTFDRVLLQVTISQNAPSQMFNWFLNMPLLTSIISTFDFEQVNDF